MICHRCETEAVKFGIQNGYQRYRCKICGKTFSDIPPNPLDYLRIEPEKAYQVIGMLVEGVGIRAIERLTGLNRRTVLNILQVAGEKCARLMDDKVKNLECEVIQADEMYGFVYCLQQNVYGQHSQDSTGTFYTFLSICRKSKLVINSLVGKRTTENAETFLHDLKGRIKNRFQLTTDGWNVYGGYAGAVKRVFGESIDYATETKYFAKTSEFEKRKLCGVRRHRRIGNPDMKQATTCHMERTNLSVRLFNRRHTRLTLGYSKNLENLKYSVSLLTAHFNFCRIHSANKVTPAVASGLTDHTWTIAELMAKTT